MIQLYLMIGLRGFVLGSSQIVRVLGFETSCDETAVAIYNVDDGSVHQELYSQVDIHKEYGGVVPEIAARDHIVHALPLLNRLLERSPYALADIDGIAYTKGPGLVGALLVGASLARSMAWALSIPSIGVHHMEAHLAAVMLEQRKPSYPYLALLVSGGHTLLVQVKALGDYKILGQTLDDAAGEAFDKTATLLGLDYPGGPALAKLAMRGRAGRYVFPRPMTKKPGLDFSFSGLKTALAQAIEVSDGSEQVRADMALAFEEAVIDTLRIKIERALAQTGLQQLVMVGGVSANVRLRAELEQYFSPQGIQVFYPRQSYCTDNAAMVAYLGAARLRAGQSEPLSIKVRPRWSMEELTIL